MAEVNLDFNKITFKVNAEDWLIKELLKEYSLLKSQNRADIGIHVKREVGFEDNVCYDASGTCFVSDNYFGFKFPLRFSSKFVLSVNPENKTIHIQLPSYFRKSFSLKNLLRKWYDLSFLDVKRQVVRFTFENVIVPSMILFGERSSPLHASSFSVGGHTYIICGSGGVGKTGTLLKLSTMGRISFYSDDWGLINGSEINLNPTWPKIYAYNLKDENVLKEVILRNRSFSDKFQWYLRKRLLGSVRRRIDPNVLFDIRNVPREIDTVFYFARTNTTTFSLEPIESKNLAGVMVKVLEYEYSSFFNHYRLLKSLKNDSNLKIKEKDGILSTIRRNYINFFDCSKNYKLCTPSNSKPLDAINYLKRQGVLEGL